MRLIKLTGVTLAIAAGLWAAHFGIADVGKLVRVTDPQIAPDGKSIALVVSRTNFEENRYDPELVLVDVATRGQRVLARERRGLSQARWSPDGSRLAFLVTVDAKPQIFVMPMYGGDTWQLTKAAAGTSTRFTWARRRVAIRPASRGRWTAMCSARSGCRTASRCW